jgi:pectate lyase
MKKLIKLMILIMTSVFLVSCEPKQTIDTVVPTEPVTEQPNETPIDYTLFENSFGFSSLIITNRSTIDEGYVIANDEVDFINALLDSGTKIIEITNDLNMGSKEVAEKLALAGMNLEQVRSVYRPHSRQPIMHPILKESGVGVVRIVLRNDLMIFSKAGSTIKHTSFLIDGSANIVFRNLHFSELWEWDELDKGTYKRNDWDYFTVEKSNGIWFDHLTFDQAYDGIIDAKEESKHMTLSWSKLNFRENDFIRAQIDYLEENIEDYEFYKSLRDSNISKEDITTFASFQKKGFNLGNTTDGEGFETITMTFHHLEVFNLMDRMPRLRKGDVHLYHVIVDNEELYRLRLKINHPDLSFVNQGMVPTEDGVILMENSIYKYVTTPIRNHQDSNPDSKYTGKYMVINSELIMPTRTYFGSSFTQSSLWVHTNPNPSIPFEFRNYEEIPYQYYLEDIYYLPNTFTNYPTGHQIIADFNWLYINLNLHVKGA